MVSDSKNEKGSPNVAVIVNKVQSTEEKVVRGEKSDGQVSEIKNVTVIKTTTKSSCIDACATRSNKKAAKKESNGNERNIIPENAQTSNDVNRTIQSKSGKVPKNTNIPPVCAVLRSNDKYHTEPLKIATVENGMITRNGAHSGKEVDNIIVNDNISNEKDLSDELFGHFPLPQTPNESNPNALSPTAAFLLSFPVVSTVSNSKPTETDNSYSEGNNLLRLEEKPNQTKEHSLFESISSILNDLNDVSTGKTIANVENASITQYPYCTTKTRSHNNEHEKSSALNDVHMTRNRQNTKNLNINNLLNDDKIRHAHGSRGGDSSKHISVDDKKQHVSECSTNAIQTNTLMADRSNYVSTKTYENLSAPTENTSDFYISLSTLGLPLKTPSNLPSAASINSSVGSHFNFQIPSLAQSRNLMDSRPLIADTPFTFSLTKCSDTISTASTMNGTTKAISQQHDDQCNQPSQSHRTNKPQKKHSPTKHLVNDRFVVPAEPTTIGSLNRCTTNTFNPFSFDNPTILSSSSSIGLGNLTTASSTCSSIGTPFAFTLTPTFSSISASTPLLTNHDPLFSSSFDMPIMRPASSLTKNSKRDNKPSLSYCNEKEQPINDKNTKHYSTIGAPTTSKPSKNLVNWMTSSVNKPAQELHLDFISSPHCTAAEEPSAWSPNRMTMDNTSHLISSSSTLPMLHGDLALNTISNNCNAPVNNKFDIDIKKAPVRNILNQKCNSKLQSHRKTEHITHSDRSGKGNKSDKTLQSYKSHQHTAPVRMNESNPIANNFHSVSQLLDQERQTSNKNSCYNSNDEKINSLRVNSNNANPTVTKHKYYSKYESESNNHLAENKFSLNACNSVSGNGVSGISGANNDIVPNDCDKDLLGGYLFGQSKRLKLNYHASSDFLSNQSFPTTYENSAANDIITPYANYQSFDSDCNNVTTSSCINNLTNQTYSYQYTQPQPSYSHQSQQQSQSACDPIETTSNYFQPPVSLSSYKPPNFNDAVRSNSKASTQQSFLHQTSKSNDPIPNSRLFPSCTTSSAAPNITPQLPLCPINRNTSACPSKTIHYPSHSNINNLPLNQAWNDSFSWMPYTNPMEKPYNNNLFNSIENSSSKTVSTNNITGNNNNTIPNFNLTTIFPDYNKS